MVGTARSLFWELFDTPGVDEVKTCNIGLIAPSSAVFNTKALGGLQFSPELLLWTLTICYWLQNVSRLNC
jgi:hypothetical protein